MTRQVSISKYDHSITTPTYRKQLREISAQLSTALDYVLDQIVPFYMNVCDTSTSIFLFGLCTQCTETSK